MGLDLLDFTFRVERTFRIKVARTDYDLLPRRAPFEATAGEMHDWVVTLCVARGVEVPPSSWNRVKVVLGEVTGTPLGKIRRHVWVVRDLGFST